MSSRNRRMPVSQNVWSKISPANLLILSCFVKFIICNKSENNSLCKSIVFALIYNVSLSSGKSYTALRVIFALSQLSFSGISHFVSRSALVSTVLLR